MNSFPVSNYFDFEQDFVASQRCIPMAVRFKLDLVGIKLSLAQWQRFDLSQREYLVTGACQTAAEINDYRQQLTTWLTGELRLCPLEENPLWRCTASVAPAVQAKAQQQGIAISLSTWAALDELARFALLKLSREGHENRNFARALVEFGLS
jgi:hypothetical protein